jgi:organic radical activating enzyme
MKCFFLDHGLTVRPDGRVAPCCQWYHGKDETKLDQDWKGYFAKKKEQLSKGWIPECRECQWSEERGDQSERLDWADGHSRWHLPTDGDDRSHWDLKLHHTCNLTCRMCTPQDSSSWSKLILENQNEPWHEHIFDGEEDDIKNKKFGWREKIPLLLSRYIDELKIIKFTGGEPMMIPQVYQVLEAIHKLGKSSEVIVRMTTNATFPLSKKWIDMLKNFKGVKFIYSVNGIKSRYEYIRQNAVWEETLKNILNMQDLEFADGSVNELYQMTCFDMVDEVSDFWKEQQIDCSWAHVTKPDYHSLHALPDHLREKYNHWEGYKFNQEYFNEFLQQSEIHDRIYGKDIRKEIPELFSKDLKLHL